MFLKKLILEGVDFIKQIYLNRFIIRELTRRDFKTNYINNLFGLSWAILEPLAMMFILWFIFTYVRTSKGMDVPFAAFLITGIIAYDFFNKVINTATRSIKSFGFLVNKVNFRAAIIPLVNVFSVSVLAHYASPEKQSVRAILMTVVRNPLIWACAIGLALNILHLPLVQSQPFVDQPG